MRALGVDRRIDEGFYVIIPWVVVDRQGNDDSSPERGGVVARAFRRAQQRVGDCTGRPVHVLRQTAASWMVQAGVPLELVGKLFGHTTLATTMRYARLRPDPLNEAMAALSIRGMRGRPARIARRLAARATMPRSIRRHSLGSHRAGSAGGMRTR